MSIRDRLAQGAAWLDQQRHRHLSSTVIYGRGDAVVEVSATVGHSQAESTDEYGRVIRTTSRDFLIRARDLVLAGQATRPEPGDHILYSDQLHEVMALAGEPCWRWSDLYQQTYRIHTQHIGKPSHA